MGDPPNPARDMPSVRLRGHPEAGEMSACSSAVRGSEGPHWRAGGCGGGELWRKGAPGEGRAQPSGCMDKGQRRSWACVHLPPLPIGAGSGTGFRVPAENGGHRMAWPLGHHPSEGISHLARFRPEDSGQCWCALCPGLPRRGCGCWLPHRAGAGVCLGHCCEARVRCTC